MGHLDDGADTASFFAEHHGMKSIELYLAARIGLVPALVFEPLQFEQIAAAVGEPAGGEEAGQSLVGLREREEDVADRHREEPLVDGDVAGCERLEFGGGLCWRCGRGLDGD